MTITEHPYGSLSAFLSPGQEVDVVAIKEPMRLFELGNKSRLATSVGGPAVYLASGADLFFRESGDGEINHGGLLPWSGRAGPP